MYDGDRARDGAGRCHRIERCKPRQAIMQSNETVPTTSPSSERRGRGKRGAGAAQGRLRHPLELCAGLIGHGNRPPGARAAGRCGRLSGQIMPAILSTTVALLAGCAPPTGVVDLAIVAPRTQAAMQQVQILPPGELPPGEVGSVGPVAGYGCGDSPAAARAGAMQQLRIKALQMRATAVEYTVTTAASAWPCAAPYAVVANGIAVARHGVPLTYSSAF